MPPEMMQELQTFLISAFWGMLVVFYYDFFRVLRGIKRHSVWMTAVEDIVFFLGVGCLLVAVFYTYNQGQVRFFVLLGLGCGVLLYNWGISPYSCGLVIFIYKKIKSLLKKITGHSTIKNKNDKDAKEGSHESKKYHER